MHGATIPQSACFWHLKSVHPGPPLLPELPELPELLPELPLLPPEDGQSAANDDAAEMSSHDFASRQVS